MKAVATAVVVLVSFLACAQQGPEAVQKGRWEGGVWAGGGTGLGDRTDWQFVNAGVRVGRVLTGEHGSGKLRGNLEWAADLIPLYYVRQPVENTYGAGFTPLLLKWNFTSGKKVVPFLEGGGGVLFTRFEVPPGTSNVNFTPQGAFGLHIFASEKRAITLSARYEHISNAGQTTPNPGINASVQFRIGYTWFK